MESKKHFPLSDEALEMIAHRFKILSEPVRLRLMQQLLIGDKNVSELAEIVHSTQANISKHLGILSAAGIVARKKNGVNTYYRIADTSIFTLCDLVCSSLQVQGSAVLELLKIDPTEGEPVNEK